MHYSTRPITVAITGASGSAYGLRLLQCLVQAECQVYLLVSHAGRVVLNTELGLALPAHPQKMASVFTTHLAANPKQIQVFGNRQWDAPVASGSNPPQAMVICPCTMGTLGGIAAGLSSNLIERAAAVTVKERRSLILVVRETPLSVLHLENMLRLAHAGVTIMPASPGFYLQPQLISDLVDFIVARILDHLGITHTITQRWSGVVEED